MNGITFYLAGASAAITYAGTFLSEQGCHIASKPSAEVTHLLLPVPSFHETGHIRGGGDLKELLAQLPETATVLGGNLLHPALKGRKILDFLKDARYLAENAAITADCALRIIGSNLDVVFYGTPILILGWGRIGKCLAAKLKALGADVTVAARKESDRAMLEALGYRTEAPDTLMYQLMRYRAVVNTVPAPLLSETQCAHCRKDCLLLDLASTPGIDGTHVLWARGLPGKDVPESSGILIGKTAIRLVRGKETVK